MMRAIYFVPLAAACFLAACGDTAEKPAGELTADDVAAEVATAVQPMPGQYRSTVELLEFDMPGMPDTMKTQMKSVAESGLAQGSSFCMTAEEADPRRMLEKMAESDCTFSQFDVAGGSVKADMVCKAQEGADTRIRMDGTMTPESSVMTMALQQTMANVGDVAMKMRVTSQRTGDCS